MRVSTSLFSPRFVAALLAVALLSTLHADEPPGGEAITETEASTRVVRTPRTPPPAAAPSATESVVKTKPAEKPASSKTEKSKQPKKVVEAILQAQRGAGGSVLSGTLLEGEDDTAAFQAAISELAEKQDAADQRPRLTPSLPPALPRARPAAPPALWLPPANQPMPPASVQLIDSLRKSARLLDDRANDEEARSRYAAADGFRLYASRLRQLARGLDTRVTQPAHYLPAPPAADALPAVPALSVPCVPPSAPIVTPYLPTTPPTAIAPTNPEPTSY